MPNSRRGILGSSLLRRSALAAAVLLAGLSTPLAYASMAAQTAPATPSSRQLGTVKSIDGTTLTLTTDAGAQVTVTVNLNARILELPPGSTDLKAATPAALSDIAPGDRVLASGALGQTPTQLNAVRVVVMKSAAIAQKHLSEQADWQRRGTGGIVTAIDPSTGALTVAAGARKLDVVTTPTTLYRRYAGDSTQFQDAKPGTHAQIQVGDQLRVRGARTEGPTGSTILSEEIVSGSFKNLSGTLLTVDAAADRLTLKDLATKRTMTVQLTPNSAIHALPPEAATRFAARQRGAEGAHPPTSQAGIHQRSAPSTPGAAGAPSASENPSAPGRSGAQDLSQLVARLPQETASVLHPGEAVMIVASAPTPSSDTVTAVTLLTGVEPILAASPSGAAAMTLSPWSVGGASPDAGGGNPE